MTCEELRSSYELYAIGVADPAETLDLREHLARGCSTCTSGVSRSRECLAYFAAAGPQVEPPRRLRSKVVAMVKPQPARTWVTWAWVATSAALLLIVFSAQQRVGFRDAFIRRQSAELARLNEAMAILNSPDASQVVFGQGAQQPPRGRVFIDGQKGVLLIASNLPPAPAGKIYEMWLIPKAGNPAPAGLFQSQQDGTAMHLRPGPVDPAATGAVAVTLEPEAGVPQPTTTPLIVAPVGD